MAPGILGVASGGPRGWAVGYFGFHFGVHFGVIFGPFWCLDSGAFLDSFRMRPGFHLGSIFGAFLDQTRAKSSRDSGPRKKEPLEAIRGEKKA